jgi:6-phosphofructo-2-kinase/fructose-2,6-biphosphatase 2
MELERHENILIIGHQAILRCIYAYFMNYNHEDLPYIKIPLHTVIELTPKAYGCEEKRFKGKNKIKKRVQFSIPNLYHTPSRY